MGPVLKSPLKSPSSLAARRRVTGEEWHNARRGRRPPSKPTRRSPPSEPTSRHREFDKKYHPFKIEDRVHWMDNEEGLGALSRIRLILVGTQSPGNIGAVCRAASNFECRDIWLVNPECDYHADEAKYMATNSSAKTILEEVTLTKTLREALAECQMAIGFTRRERHERMHTLPFKHIEYPSRGVTMGLVFGREDDGLTNEEVEYCTHLCTIPTSKWEGSLNLSHAVTLTLANIYDKYRHLTEKGKALVPNKQIDYSERTAPLGELHFLMKRWKHVLTNANVAASLVLKPEVKTTEMFLKHVTKILYKGRPTAREAQSLHGFLSLVERNSHTIGNLVCHMQAQESDEEDEEDEDYETFLKKALADEKAREEEENWPLDDESNDSEYDSDYEAPSV